MGTTKRAMAGFIATALLSGCSEDFSGSTDVESTTSALTTTATKSLLITSTTVTRNATRTVDPCGAVAGNEDRVWTIGHMLKREAQKNGITPANYVNAWVNAWRQPNYPGTKVIIYGQEVPPLLGPSVAADWTRFAGGNTAFPLHKAPFYLLAITSRLDLRKHRPLNEPLGGEVRFVFGMLAANQNSPACPSTMYAAASTLILEYSPAKSDENQVRDYARRWLDLSNQTGSAYLTALQNLTEEVINNGKLLRIRTNEGTESPKVGGNPTGWDLGEFAPNPSTKLMERTTVKQSPTMALAGNNSQQLSDWIWSQRDALWANAFDYEIGRIGTRSVTAAPIASYSVPNQFPGTQTSFRGSLNTIPTSNFWSGPNPTGLTSDQLGDWSDARFRFSVGTCNGCHALETQSSALHIQPASPGAPPSLSAFLRGVVDVPDPVTGGVRQFDEMFRRENDLRALVNGSPVLVPVFGNNYEVVFRNSNKCLDSLGNTSNDNAAAVLWGCHGNANQRLSLVAAGSGSYNLKYKHSGKCLDIQNGSTQSGAAAVQMPCNGASNSQKVFLDTLWNGVAPAPRAIRFKHSNLCLLPQNQATADGTALVQGACPTASDFAKGLDFVE